MMDYQRHASYNAPFSGHLSYSQPYYNHDLSPTHDDSLFPDQARFVGQSRHAAGSYPPFDGSYFGSHAHRGSPMYSSFVAADHDDDSYSSRYSTAGSPNTGSRGSSPLEKRYHYSHNPYQTDPNRARLSVKPLPASPAAVNMKPHCPHPDCRDASGNPRKYFSRKADVARHDRSHHNRSFMDCPRHRCSRKGESGFTRRDHLQEHLRQYHSMNIPKRGSGSVHGTRGPRKEGRHRHAA